MHGLFGFLHRLMGSLHFLIQLRVLLDRLVMGSFNLGPFRVAEIGHRTMPAWRWRRWNLVRDVGILRLEEKG